MKKITTFGVNRSPAPVLLALISFLIPTDGYPESKAADDRSRLLISITSQQSATSLSYSYTELRDTHAQTNRGNARRVTAMNQKNLDGVASSVATTGKWAVNLRSLPTDELHLPNDCMGTATKPVADTIKNSKQSYQFEYHPCYWIPTVQYVEDRIAEAVPDYFANQIAYSPGWQNMVDARVKEETRSLHSEIDLLKTQIQEILRREARR